MRRKWLLVVCLVAPMAMPGPAALAQGEVPPPLPVLSEEQSADALLRLGELYERGEGVPVDLALARRYYEQAASAGSDTAKVRVGLMIIAGEGGEKDPVRGAQMISEVAATGNGTAYLALGDAFAGGQLGISVASAVEAYENAAALGRDEALLRLGDLLSDPLRTTPDLPKAYRYYGRAMDLGSTTGRLRVGEMLTRGEGVVADVSAGLTLIEEAANAGSVSARILLGDLYAGEGSLVAPDRERSLYQFRTAARSGEANALFKLAEALMSESPSEASADEILSTYEAAASAGSTDALLLLGEIYSSGELLAADLARAYAYYQRAAAAGSATARLRVAEMLARGQGVVRDTAKGLAGVRAEFEAGSASAAMSLGELLSTGEAGTIDSDAAVAAFEEAARRGRPDAYVKIGDLYREGLVVPGSPRRAAEFYQKATSTGDLNGLYLLGAGYVDRSFGQVGTAAEGLELLAEAERSGNEYAVTATAEAYLRGLGVRADLERGLAILTEAAEKGNAAAGLYLVAIYRDGLLDQGRRIVRKDLAAARRYLEVLEGRVDRGTYLYQSLLLEAAQSKPADLESTLKQIAELSTRDRQSLLARLLAVNENAYVAVAQAQLQKLGFYSGAATGTLDRTTIRAIGQYCSERGVTEICRNGPMTIGTARVISFSI